MLAKLTLVLWTAIVGLYQAPPTPSELIARHAKASGGREALDRHSSIDRSGEVSIESLGITGAYRVRRASNPDRYMYEMSLGSIGAVTRGFDGAVGWDIGPVGDAPRFLEDDELETRVRAASYHADLREPELTLPMQTVGRGDWEGADCWRVDVTLPTGDTRQDYYDADSGLYHGSVDEVSSPVAGAAARTIVVQRYEAFEGAVLPTVILQRMPQFETVFRITHTSFDVVPVDVFKAPARKGAHDDR